MRRWSSFSARATVGLVAGAALAACAVLPILDDTPDPVDGSSPVASPEGASVDAPRSDSTTPGEPAADTGGPLPEAEATDAGPFEAGCALTRDGSVVSGCVPMTAVFRVYWSLPADAGCAPDATVAPSLYEPGVTCCSWTDDMSVSDAPTTLRLDADGGYLTVGATTFGQLRKSQYDGVRDQYYRASAAGRVVEETMDASLGVLAEAGIPTAAATAFITRWSNGVRAAEYGSLVQISATLVPDAGNVDFTVRSYQSAFTMDGTGCRTRAAVQVNCATSFYDPSYRAEGDIPPKDASVPPGADAAPFVDDAGPAVVETVYDAGSDVSNFDFNASNLVYRLSTGWYSCPLDNCVAPAGPFPSLASRSAALGGDNRFYSPEPSGLTSVALDWTGQRNERNPSIDVQSSYVLHTGHTNVLYVARERSSPSAAYNVGTFTLDAAMNLSRVPRSNGYENSNFGGAFVRYRPSREERNPEATIETSGAIVPLPPTQPQVLVVSERGPQAPYPAVVGAWYGHLWSCSTSGASCPAWTHLGPFASDSAIAYENASILADATHLYVGTAAGVGRCTLQEIVTRGTCTVVPRTTLPFRAPLLATRTHVYFASGGRIVRFAK